MFIYHKERNVAWRERGREEEGERKDKSTRDSENQWEGITMTDRQTQSSESQKRTTNLDFMWQGEHFLTLRSMCRPSKGQPVCWSGNVWWKGDESKQANFRSHGNSLVSSILPRKKGVPMYCQRGASSTTMKWLARHEVGESRRDIVFVWVLPSFHKGKEIACPFRGEILSRNVASRRKGIHSS